MAIFSGADTVTAEGSNFFLTPILLGPYGLRVRVWVKGVSTWVKGVSTWVKD
jgi:hypothetical protein